MADHQFRIRNSLFSNYKTIYGSHDYTIDVGDMPEYPHDVDDVIDKNMFTTKGGRIKSTTNYAKIVMRFTFADVLTPCMATFASMFRDNIPFLFYEDPNNTGAISTFFPSGTGTCMFNMNVFNKKSDVPGLWSFNIEIIELDGRMNEAS